MVAVTQGRTITAMWLLCVEKTVHKQVWRTRQNKCIYSAVQNLQRKRIVLAAPLPTLVPISSSLKNWPRACLQQEMLLLG